MPAFAKLGAVADGRHASLGPGAAPYLSSTFDKRYLSGVLGCFQLLSHAAIYSLLNVRDGSVSGASALSTPCMDTGAGEVIGEDFDWFEQRFTGGRL